jgi:hypothetical protein
VHKIDRFVRDKINIPVACIEQDLASNCCLVVSSHSLMPTTSGCHAVRSDLSVFCVQCGLVCATSHRLAVLLLSFLLPRGA